MLFGGTPNDREFEAWLDHNCEHTYRFDALKKGDVKRFARAVNESTNMLVKKDYHGTETGRVRANDTMLVHVEEKDLKLVSSNLDRVKCFLILARDADLNTMTCSYGSRLAEELAKKIWEAE